MKPPRTDALQGTSGYLKYFLEEMAKVLARNVSFGSSFDNTSQDQNIQHFKANGISPGTANTPFTISAGAGAAFFRDNHVPIGWFIVDQNAAGDFYRSGTLNASTLTLACTAASVGYSVIII